ncbi:head GIN domain-containing protein [uncultured Pontibacter sp.]|uniref:head GIN domain-containing protein n=1 Tax=uncultured Pontibacter sp. TaxID=453356 RepID=UPI00260CA347|nr:head GIN domain-containing protein [uncultured Pontibacter sp.]
MKKKFNVKEHHTGFAVALLFLSIILSGCNDTNCIKGEGSIETRTLNLDPFTSVDANGDFIVYITQGATQQVEVKGESNILDQLRTDIRNNTWKIEHRDCVRRSKQVEIYITMPVVDALAMNGSGRINCQGNFIAEDIPVQVNGSGKIELNVDARQVMSRVSGSGEIVLAGEAVRHSVNISGSGRAEAFALQAENVTVNISGSGVAEVSAAATLTVDISGSGNVYYQGNPTVSQNVSGSGRVIKR